jgi:hypothetical protein
MAGRQALERSEQRRIEAFFPVHDFCDDGDMRQEFL